MQAGKNQSGTVPTAFGSMLQASTYGMTIPVIYGQTISPLLAIWANNLRQGGSTKKFKQMKKGITAYCENIDFLIGHNPILGVLQFWNNSAKIPLGFTSYTTSLPGGSVQVQVGNFSGLPDPNFYAVIGVTISGSYSQTFNDYGAASSSTVSGSWEIPLWNELVAGPDPVHGAALRNCPYCYRWQPSYGPYIYIDSPDFFGTTVNIYYARTIAATSYLTPAAKLRLQFENILGSGTEYAGFSGEQIQYPQFAGLGSDSIDLGSSGTIPSIKPEVQGKFGIYPSGDCDFVDIIEDVVKSGVMQSAIGGAEGFGKTHAGVALSGFPGCIQSKVVTSIYQTGNVSYNLPTAAGNFLFVLASGGGTTLTISDSGGNTWTPVLVPGSQRQAWYATAVGGPVTVTIGGYLGLTFNTQVSIFEIAGVDSFDSVVVGTAGTASLVTSNAANYPGYVLAVGMWFFLQKPDDPELPNWDPVLAADLSMYRDSINDQTNYHLVLERRVNSPGTVSVRLPHSPQDVFLLAFKCVQPPTYPKPLLDVLENRTADLTRMQCRAAGLWGSLAMTAQKPASEWLKDLVMAANCAPVWSGFKLKLVPRSEVSAAGNGVIYNAPTASGPVANLDADKGDFIGETPITVIRKARTDLATVLQMQHINRTSDYQQVVSAEADPASIALYGVRKADPIVNNAVHDVSVARSLLRIAVRRKNYVENVVWQFRLNARWQLLEPMDLVTVTDRSQGIVEVPVRLTMVEEDEKFELSCEAEPFIYGMSAPQTLSVTNTTPYSPNPGISAGDVNAPVIFEPVIRLYGAQNQSELWLVVSSPSTDYGGCQVMISTDGGSSYNSAGDPMIGNGITGVTVGTWAAAASPDTTNDLAVDLTESLGVLSSYQTADEDNFVYPCYVEGTSSPIPYELMTYAVATLTAANKYTLKATGTGHHLNRGVFGAPTLGTGASHAGGSRFALLSPDGVGILKLQMDPLWVGKTLYFKFLSFNTFGSAVQQLADVSPYTYTPSGGSGSVNPAGLPSYGFQVNGV